MGQNLYQSLTGLLVGLGAALTGLITLVVPLAFLNVAPPLAATTPVTIGTTALPQNQVIGALLLIGGVVVLFFYMKKRPD